MSGPRVMCNGCGEVEVGIFMPLCDECLCILQAEELRAEAEAERAQEWATEMRRDAYGDPND